MKVCLFRKNDALCIMHMHMMLADDDDVVRACTCLELQVWSEEDRFRCIGLKRDISQSCSSCILERIANRNNSSPMF